jgi:hypothetical protein
MTPVGAAFPIGQGIAWVVDDRRGAHRSPSRANIRLKAIFAAHIASACNIQRHVVDFERRLRNEGRGLRRGGDDIVVDQLLL